MSAYSSHGWEFPGTDSFDETVPINVNDCGGVSTCLDCRRELKVFRDHGLLPELGYDFFDLGDDEEEEEESSESYPELVGEYESSALEALENSSISLTNGATVNAQVYATQAHAFAMLALIHV